MKIYNTLTRKKEDFELDKKEIITMYTCGVTVYGPIHIGHARTYIAYDMIKNYFRHFKNKNVLHVQNITDVGHIVGDIDYGEDKIQRKANSENKHPMEIVDEYIKVLWEGLDGLKCDRPNISPRATGHIIEIIDAVKKLIDKKYAYEVGGSVYFDIAKFPKYGTLSGNNLNKLSQGVRIDLDNAKRNPMDFALWKNAESNHIMQWSSPWGLGYPGWHIECSVMSTKYLGETFDIHGGAIELSFPHHENEIAQSEALTGKQMVRFWVHTGLLSINGQKMSKSLENFITVEDALKENTPEVLRYFVLSNAYRSPINMKKESLEAAISSLSKINNFILQVQTQTGTEYNKEMHQSFNEFKANFESTMDDDFNTPVALSHVHMFINNHAKNIRESKYDFNNRDEIISFYKKMDSVFKFMDFKQKDATIQTDTQIDDLINQRNIARQCKDWKKADELRDTILSKGVELFDNKDGTSTYKRK